jgi:hypothetical protein
MKANHEIFFGLKIKRKNEKMFKFILILSHKEQKDKVIDILRENLSETNKK